MGTRKILVCQHVGWEILGTLDPMFKTSGFRIRYANFGRHPDTRPTLDGYRGLVLLGGPMSVYQQREFPHLKFEMGLIEEALRRELPILGICLGAQLLSATLGGRVYANPCREIGWYDLKLSAAGHEDPLLTHVGDGKRIFQWHQDTFSIPDGAVHLASTATCDNQAFRYGERTYGFQFHLEVEQSLIERWLNVPVHLDEMAKSAIDPRQISAETPMLIDDSMALSTQIFGAFIDLFGRRKRTTLGSR